MDRLLTKGRSSIPSSFHLSYIVFLLLSYPYLKGRTNLFYKRSGIYCPLSYPILSYPILSYPILTYPILLYPIPTICLSLSLFHYPIHLPTGQNSSSTNFTIQRAVLYQSVKHSPLFSFPFLSFPFLSISFSIFSLKSYLSYYLSSILSYPNSLSYIFP